MINLLTTLLLLYLLISTIWFVMACIGLSGSIESLRRSEESKYYAADPKYKAGQLKIARDRVIWSIAWPIKGSGLIYKKIKDDYRFYQKIMKSAAESNKKDSNKNF